MVLIDKAINKIAKRRFHPVHRDTNPNFRNAEEPDEYLHLHLDLHQINPSFARQFTGATAPPALTFLMIL